MGGSRIKLTLLTGVLLFGVVIISASGSGQADEGLQGDALEEASPNPTATVDIGIDVDPAEMVAAAIEYSKWREAIVSGEPEVLLAVPGWPESIRQMGIDMGNWDPTCKRPMYLVILKGNFDGRSLFVDPGDEGPEPGKYLAYVFDLADGVPGFVTATFLGKNGASFKQALGDPTLPDSDVTVSEPSPPYPPCEDVTLPGNP